jgi:hypothetical protein
MTTRIGLIILQAAGALSIVPYPFILLANVMSIAAPGQTVAGATPFILLTVYPLIFLGLDVFAWRLLGRGKAGLAFALSAIPLLFIAAGIGLLSQSNRSVNVEYAKRAEEERAAIEPVNPLLWKVMCTGGPNLLPAGPVMKIDDVIDAIDANQSYINVAVDAYGTPLRVALQNFPVHPDGTFIGDGRPKEGLVRLVRALVAHGAKLGPPTVRGDMLAELRLKWVMMDGSVTTESENPLVWRILHRDFSKQFQIAADELPLINKPTRLHGTPLSTVLLMSARDLFVQFINAGARLTPEEEQDRATAAELEKMLVKFPELRRVYGKQ